MCHDTKEDQQRIVEGIASAQQLGSYSAKIGETSVSGISSDAFMTVQLGVAHSADVKGVGVTAGGPYFCAESIFSNELTISKVVACCMQGDPDYSATQITSTDLNRLPVCDPYFSLARNQSDSKTGVPTNQACS